MPLRLTLLLALILLFFLLVSSLNPSEVDLRLWADVVFTLNIAVVMLLSFIGGVLAVYFLFFYDTIADTLAWLRNKARGSRAKRLEELYGRAVEKVTLQQPAEATKYLRRALSHDKNHVASLILLGRLLREAGEVSEATKLHARGAGLADDNIVLALELADDYVAARNPENALTVLQKIEKKGGRSIPPLRAMREIYIGASSFSKAAAAQKEIVAVTARHEKGPELALLAALTYADASLAYGAGDAASATTLLKTALRTDPTFVPPYLKLAEMAERGGNNNDADRLLERGFKATHSLVILKFSEALLIRRGAAALIAGRYRWARDQAPEQILIPLLLAAVCIKAEEWGEAERLLQSVSGELIQTPLYHLSFSAVERHKGNEDVFHTSVTAAMESAIGSLFHFGCATCGETQYEYADRCPACQAWGTLHI